MSRTVASSRHFVLALLILVLAVGRSSILSVSTSSFVVIVFGTSSITTFPIIFWKFITDGFSIGKIVIVFTQLFCKLIHFTI